jgi:hypothetical protein
MTGKEIIPCALPYKEKIKTIPSKKFIEIRDFLLSTLNTSYFSTLPKELRVMLLEWLQKAKIKLKPINKSPIKQSFGPPKE